MSKTSLLRTRRAQRADAMLVSELFAREEACRFDLPSSADFDRDDLECEVVEANGRVIAVGRHRIASTEMVAHLPDPLPVDERPWRDGPHLTLIGEGLVFAKTPARERARAVLRLLRTLRADELGARYTLTRVPLITHDVYDDAGTCQQIAHGAIDWPPVSIPLEDGYWPLRVASDRTVWLLREARWA